MSELISTESESINPANRLISRRGALALGASGGLAVLVAGLGGRSANAAVAPSAGWRRYPFDLFPGDPNFTFPSVDGIKPDHGTDSWYVSGKLVGTSGREYGFITIFCKNRIASVIRADFFAFALFDLQTGDYGTFTEFDFPPADFFNAAKFTGSSDLLDLHFSTGQGPVSWTNRRDSNGKPIPFSSQVNLRGVDQHSRKMTLVSTIDPANPPTAIGPDKGYIECFGQQNTGTYFQTAPHFNGSLSWGGITEQVTGTLGHIDRQWFPEAAFSSVGITAHGISHEWRNVNLSDGTDLSLWRQFDRTNGDALLPFTGSTRFIPGAPGSLGQTKYTPDIEVEYLSFVKWPTSVGTFVPAASPNRYAPAAHIVRIPSWDLELTATPTTPAPAHDLPVEYMIGPMRWEGTLAGKPITGFGMFERTLIYFQDWELVKVLRTTVTNLPATAFTRAGATRATLLGVVNSLDSLVSKNQRIQLAAKIEFVARPMFSSLVGPSRSFLLTLLSDLETAPSGIY